MRKSVRSFMAAVLVLSFGSSSLAQANCREKFQSRIGDRTGSVLLSGAGGGVAGVVTGVVIAFPIGIAAGVVTMLVLGKHTDRTAIRLLNEAEAGHGKKIRRLYNKYLDRAKDPVSFSEFCQIIHEADANENLCKNDVKLHKGDLVLYVQDRE
ncbi:MAG: hypothetical protein JST04_03360 [Bdellovibrionales bacterium]|nr:hypothetical protein [Bdellovibrionales bacterium]